MEEIQKHTYDASKMFKGKDESMEFILDMLIGVGLVFFFLVTFVIFDSFKNRKREENNE